MCCPRHRCCSVKGAGRVVQKAALCLTFACCAFAGPWLENYVSLTSSRLSSMSPDTQANLLSSLAVWRAKLSPAWLAMFQLNCVKQAEDGSMKADQLEQVGAGMRGRHFSFLFSFPKIDAHTLRTVPASCGQRMHLVHIADSLCHTCIRCVVQQELSTGRSGHA